MPDLARSLLAEFIGTLGLVFFAAGSILLAHPEVGAGSLMTVAAAHICYLTVFVGATIYISGAQFNPAVSIALSAIGRQPWTKTGAYVLTQLLGAASGVGALVLIVGTDSTMGGLLASDQVRHGSALGMLAIGGEVGDARVVQPSAGGLFLAEAIQTFALMYVIMYTLVDRRAAKLGGLYVGLVVGACILAFGPLSGSSMNPARSFGPAVYGHWQHHWIYWAAPILGAVSAAWIYRLTEREAVGAATEPDRT